MPEQEAQPPTADELTEAAVREECEIFEKSARFHAAKMAHLEARVVQLNVECRALRSELERLYRADSSAMSDPAGTGG